MTSLADESGQDSSRCKRQQKRRNVSFASLYFGFDCLTSSVVEALGELFREMITSPRASVTPHQELVKLTLMTSPAAEKIRRKSTIGSANRPSLGHIDGREV